MAVSLYRCFGAGGKLLYVGISEDPLRRWIQHRREKPWWPEVVNLKIEALPTRELAIALEQGAIVEESPKYNIRGRSEAAWITPSWAWEKLVGLEPAIGDLYQAIRPEPCGVHHDPVLCGWYGYCETSSRWKGQLSSLAGWSRGRGWAYPSEPLAAEVTEDGLEIVWASSIPSSPSLAKRRFREKDEAKGRGWLWTPHAYDVGYQRLWRALNARAQGLVA